MTQITVSGDWVAAVWVGSGDEVVAIGDIVWRVVACAFTVVVDRGNASRMLKVEDAVTSFEIPDTFIIYSSGLNVDVSTSNDQVLYPPGPGRTS